MQPLRKEYSNGHISDIFPVVNRRQFNARAKQPDRFRDKCQSKPIIHMSPNENEDASVKADMARFDPKYFCLFIVLGVLVTLGMLQQEAPGCLQPLSGGNHTTHMRTYIHAYIHTHTNTNTHRHTHTHTHTHWAHWLGMYL